MGLSVNWKRAEEVLGNLLAAYKGNRPPYDQMVLPHVDGNLPPEMPRGGREHTLFLFASCYYMRGGIKSDVAMRRLAAMYNDDAWHFPRRTINLFRPEIFLDMIPHEGIVMVQDKLRRHGLNFQSEQVSRFWVLNAQKLALHWGGDPRNLFADATSYEDVCARIIRTSKKSAVSPEQFCSEPKGFFGFREKMVSMLAYYLIDSGLIPNFPHPVPVDFHVMRVLVSNEVIVSDDGSLEGFTTGETALYGREVTARYCQMHGIDPIELCNALWFLSRAFCRRQPGNRSTSSTYKARATEVSERPVVWTREAYRRYRRTCGVCAIRPTCRHNIPALRYYRHGLLFLRGERPEPPQMDLFLDV